jgi:23S rRNA (cytosine1962-C5)-methyltransferase
VKDNLMPDAQSPLTILTSPAWADYELLDSGNGLKLERYGPNLLIRPEPQAMWSPALGEETWGSAHATFQPAQEESGGHWHMNRPMPPEWQMRYRALKFVARLTAGRHLGVFPEQACHWDWTADLIEKSKRPIQVLNLFGYTGLATLAAARAGARVTHIDASKKSVGWARENQALSVLNTHPIRWIVDDALKFVQREGRRGVQYDGIILDPPKFGRGPKGEVWEFFDLFPLLMAACLDILSAKPLFLVVTAYAIRASALSLYNNLIEMTGGLGGQVSAGELALTESSAGRLVSTAIFARWQARQD